MSFIDIHVLQTVPPSNLNRDDTGNPKSAIYGGQMRARVSSQAWKRAIRMAFRETLDPATLGERTLRVVQLLSDRIQQHDAQITANEADKLAADVFSTLGIKMDKPRASKSGDQAREDALLRSTYLMFLSSGQLDRLASLAIAAHGSGTKIDKKEAKHAAQQDNSVDVAMFGRMVADDGDLNVDAAVQVAHAISVHAVEPEHDYWTAVDDRNVDDQGAGMIGTLAFNSATLYRYATINVEGLMANLGNVAATSKAVQAFVRAFVTSMPTGKQNSFANRTLPHAVVVMVRADQPVNLAGAFEDAVKGEGRVGSACEALGECAKEFADNYGVVPQHTYVVRAGAETAALDRLGERCSLDALVVRLDELVGNIKDPVSA